MWPDPTPIYTTTNKTTIYAAKGGKSQFNFKVQYKEPRKRMRTPKHIHLIIDLFMKKTGNRDLTIELVEHFINEIVLKVKPSNTNPPTLQIFKPRHVGKFIGLDKYGEYPIDFLLVVTEMIMIQEKTNYPNGVMNLKIFNSFKNEADIFSIVSAATFTGR